MTEENVKELINVLKGVERELCLLDRESHCVAENLDFSKDHREFGQFVYDRVQTGLDSTNLIYGIIQNCIFNGKKLSDELFDEFLDTFDFTKSTSEIYENLIKLRDEVYF